MKRLTNEEKILMEPCAVGIGNDMRCATDKEWVDNSARIIERVGPTTYLRGLIKILRESLGSYRNGVPEGISSEDWAKIIILNCVRNTELEDLHSGITPSSVTGDYSDVKVVSPYGEIEWNNLSRISDDEMKMLMISFINRLFTIFSVPLNQLALRPAPPEWDKPEIVKGMTMQAIIESLEADGLDARALREHADLTD